MSKHTEGPWETDCHFMVRAGSTIYTFKADRAPAGELRANANLIAAAPELLEALEGWLEIAEAKKQYLGSTGDRVRAAIAKAKGEVTDG